MKSTHEFFVSDEDVRWLSTPMAGRIGRALFRRETAASYEELQIASDVAFEVSDYETTDGEGDNGMDNKPEDVGSGALFKNDRKEKPSHPDYRGDCTIEGMKFWVSGWIKEGKSGKYMSLAFRRADDPAEAKSKSTDKAVADRDAIPF
jgi:hypothetical protein